MAFMPITLRSSPVGWNARTGTPRRRMPRRFLTQVEAAQSAGGQVERRTEPVARHRHRRAHDDEVELAVGQQVGVRGGVCAPVDERDAADRHRLEEARDGARRRHRVGNRRRRRAGAAEHDTVPVAEAHRGQPQVPLGPFGPEQRAERGRDELGRHRPRRERAGQHHAGPVHPERSQRRPHEERRRRHAREPPATGRAGRKARRSVTHAGPAHELGPLG